MKHFLIGLRRVGGKSMIIDEQANDGPDEFTIPEIQFGLERCFRGQKWPSKHEKRLFMEK
jgi:hypothetical protein